MRTQAHCRVIIREVVIGHLYVDTLVKVTAILICDSVPVVLRVSGNEVLTAVLIGNDVYSGNIRGGQYLKLRNPFDVLSSYLCIA